MTPEQAAHAAPPEEEMYDEQNPREQTAGSLSNSDDPALVCARDVLDECVCECGHLDTSHAFVDADSMDAECRDDDDGPCGCREFRPVTFLVTRAATDRDARLTKALWTALDVVREHVGAFEHWPVALKDAFADAIVSREPLTEEEIQWTHELATRFGWKLS